MTRQRVLAAIETLGYVPDSAAQSMARRSKEAVGFVAIDARDPEHDVEREGSLFIDEVLHGVESALSPLGWPVLIAVYRADDRQDARQWLHRMSARVDGLLIAEGFEPAGSLIKLASRIPIVLVAGSPETPDIDVVGADNRVGTKSLVSHLIERHGRSRFWYVAGPSWAPDARERYTTFEETLAGYQGVRLAGRSEGPFFTLTGQLAVREILGTTRGEMPDAIVCANDQMAMGAIQELRTAGIRVPADVSVTGFDDFYLGALVTPQLTTVRQPMRLLGERACTLLLERIADPERPPRVERLPTELIVRESCGCRSPRPRPAGRRRPE